jgi:hypothetical protein
VQLLCIHSSGVIIYFRLERVKDAFTKQGVECFEDLQSLCEDNELIGDLSKDLNKLDFKKLKKAVALSTNLSPQSCGNFLMESLSTNILEWFLDKVMS